MEQFQLMNNSSQGYRGTFFTTVSKASRKIPARLSRTRGYTQVTAYIRTITTRILN